MADDELLATVATWYYEEQLGQSEIAKKLNKSRSMVSRFLQEARERGIVSISIQWPLKRDKKAEHLLRERFGLRDAWVSTWASQDDTILLRALGVMGAECLITLLDNGTQISMGWGRTLYELVRSIQKSSIENAHVVQAIGVVGSGDQPTEGSELVRILAQKIQATFELLPAPLFVENESVARSIMDLKSIDKTLRSAKTSDVALLGIGSLEPSESSLFQQGHLSREEIAHLKDAGAVGSILGYQLDREGRVLDLSLHKRIIGLTPNDLENINTVVAVAGGHDKAPAIRASLQGGYLDVLVTDRITAYELLN